MLRELIRPATLDPPAHENLQLSIAMAWGRVWPGTDRIALGLQIERASVDIQVRDGAARKVMIELDREARDVATAATLFREAGYAVRALGDGFVGDHGAFQVVMMPDTLVLGYLDVEPGVLDIAEMFEDWPRDVVELARARDVRFVGMRFEVGRSAIGRIRFNLSRFDGLDDLDAQLRARGFVEEPYRAGSIPWLEQDYEPPHDGDVMIRDRVVIVGGGTRSAYLRVSA